MSVALSKFSLIRIRISSVFTIALLCLFLFNSQYFQAQTAVPIPNVFTPNNDNINDEFSINLSGIIVTDYNIKIYNNWGVLMFSSQNANINWDGRTSTGVKVPEGNYYYIVIINGKPYSGALSLIY